MKQIKIGNDEIYNRYRLVVGKIETHDDALSTTEIYEPINEYEKLFQSVAQSIINQAKLFDSGPFHIEYDISEISKKGSLCRASLMSIYSTGIAVIDDSSDRMRSELSYIHLQGFSAWTDHIGLVNLTVQMSPDVLDKRGKECLTLLHTIAAQAYYSASNQCKQNANTLYMGTFRPC